MPINAGGKVTPAAAAALFSPASAANRVPTSASLGPYSRMAATGDAPRPRVRHAEIERRASAAAPRARHALIQARASAAPLWGAEDDARAGAAGRERGSGIALECVGTGRIQGREGPYFRPRVARRLICRE